MQNSTLKINLCDALGEAAIGYNKAIVESNAKFNDCEKKLQDKKLEPQAKTTGVSVSDSDDTPNNWFVTLDSAYKGVCGKTLSESKIAVSQVYTQIQDEITKAEKEVKKKADNFKNENNASIQKFLKKAYSPLFQFDSNILTYAFGDVSKIKSAVTEKFEKITKEYTLDSNKEPLQALLTALIDWHVKTIAIGASHLSLTWIEEDGSKNTSCRKEIVNNLKTQKFWNEVKEKTCAAIGKEEEGKKKKNNSPEAVSAMLQDSQKRDKLTKIDNMYVALDYTNSKHFFIHEVTKENAAEVCQRMVDEFYNKRSLNWNGLTEELKPQVEANCLLSWKQVKFDGGDLTPLSQCMPPERSWAQWLSNIRDADGKLMKQFITDVVGTNEDIQKEIKEDIEQWNLKCQANNSDQQIKLPQFISKDVIDSSCDSSSQEKLVAV